MTTETLLKLKELIARHGTPEHAALRALPGVTLMAITQPTQPFLHVCEPALTIVAQGVQRISLGETPLDCGAGQYLVIPVDLPLAVQVLQASPERPFLSVSLSLRAEKISSLLLEAQMGLPHDPAPAGLAVSDTAHALIDAVVRLLGMLEQPADIPVLAAAVEREVLWRLINGPQGAMVRQLGIANSRMTQIGIAIGRLRSSYADPIRVAELARAVGMSVTSFHRHFRAITSLTPIAYQKQIRLQVARSRLMCAAEDVAALGFAVGYDSSSQFSREYKRLFGHPPRQHGERLRRQGNARSEDPPPAMISRGEYPGLTGTARPQSPTSPAR